MLKKIQLILTMRPSILVGGQAVIEGVMMRVPGAYATAVRNPEGEIEIDRHEFTSRVERSRFWKAPVLRGIISLYEAMKMGFATLQWSADIAMPQESENSKPGTWSGVFSTLFAVALAITLFLIGPLWVTTRLLDLEREALLFNVVSGGFRIFFFLIYLVSISLLKEVKRLFQYHGAEHRVVYNFESGRDVTVHEAQSFPTQHPRCGTSFLFIVLISAILVFAMIDTLIISIIGTITLPIRLLFHLPLIPLVAGISYEVIKFTAKNGNNRFVRVLRAPGMWLQNITTGPPEDAMVEVAIRALKSAFGDHYSEMAGKEYVAEAIG